MDVYSTSFTHPRPSQFLQQHSYSPTSSIDFTPDLRTPRDNFPPTVSPAPPRSRIPPPTTDVSTPYLGTTSEFGFDAVHNICMEAMATHGCLVSYTRVDDGRAWNFHISGGYQQVMAARGMILSECPVQVRSVIKVARTEILESPSSPALLGKVRRRLDEIASLTHARISVVNAAPSAPLPGSDGMTSWNGLEIEKMCELVINGVGDGVDAARILLLVMLDEMSGLHTESVEIDHKLHSIIVGPKRSVLHSIQEETGTNIYLPRPLPHLGAPAQGTNTIWITGEFFDVQRARDMLYQVSVMKSKTIISRDTAILPRKLDWMLLDRQDDLKSTMIDHGTYINFPPVGSQTSMITVFGDNRAQIQKSIRAIMQLACQFYVGSVWLLPVQFNMLMPASAVNPSAVPPVLKTISNLSNAEFVFKSNCFEAHGLEHEVRSAIGMILEQDIARGFQHEIRFQLELAIEHRDFISGKKNGKINKIMQTAGVKIKFETFNEHNFLIDIAGNDGGALHGLTMLEEELPAEISFHVPEAYHKRIIGVGGRSIQRIMKRYGVYVKFNSSEELAAALLDDNDNVIARTPAKNALNLENLKQAVMELVNPKDKDFILETVSVPRRYHRSLFGEKSVFVHDIEAKTNSKIRFPGDGTDIVTIYGPESQVHIAAAMLLDHVPFEADMVVPPQVEVSRLASTPDFIAFAEKMKREYQVVVIPGGADESVFKLRCQRSHSDILATVRDLLSQFLTSKNIRVYPMHTHRRVDSFTDAFPHFDSKLLSTATAETSELSRPAEGFVERRIRLASSTPDVKALFNNPSGVYKLDERDEYEEPNHNRSSYGSTVPMNEYWGSPRILQPPRPVDDSFKRGSDSLLESKLKERSVYTKPRSLTNRAQSLDLTSLSRSGSINTISEALKGSADEEEEDLALGNTIPPSPPASATIPSFPSVYGPPLLAKQKPTTGRPRPLIEDPYDVEEVSRVISQIKLDTAGLQ